MQEENHRLAKFNEELSKKNLALAKRLRDNGLDDSIQISENIHDVATVIKRSQVFQGTKYLIRSNLSLRNILRKFGEEHCVGNNCFISATGMFKYRPEEIGKIIQRLVDDLTPRVAITLFPGLPAYIVFMCLR